MSGWAGASDQLPADRMGMTLPRHGFSRGGVFHVFGTIARSACLDGMACAKEKMLILAAGLAVHSGIAFAAVWALVHFGA